jgi:copper(I)-binding protein
MRPVSIMLVVCLALVAWPATAEDVKIGSIEIVHPWSRATPKGAKVGGAYLTIRNTGTTADRLVGGSIPIAARLEVHEMTMDGGVMKMRPLKGGLEVKPGETVALEPGGLHLMFVDLTAPLERGKPVKATLAFEHAGTVEVTFDVEAIGAQSSGHGDHGKMGH